MLSGMSIQEIKTEIEALPAEERKRLAAFLVSLRHKELDEYRTGLGRKIDDKNPENWISLEELDQRLEA
jgi:DNA-binding transcriptional MerR regulator